VDAVLAAVYESPDGRVDPLMVALREAREATGLSQATVARRLRVTVETVRSDETGRRQPNLARLRGYADVYGVDLAVVARSQP
jgi:transcriptional regulator with XRE-family HTH domain